MKWATLFFTICLGVWSAEAETLSESERLFAGVVEPLLSQKCGGCHGAEAEKLKGGYDLRDREGAFRGGESGEPAIVEGAPERSGLMEAILRGDPDTAMPPKDSEALTPEEIGAMRRWITLGAVWLAPSELSRVRDTMAAESTSSGHSVKTSGGVTEAWTRRTYQSEDLWAFQPLIRPDIPRSEGRSADANSHPVDAFIDRKLSEEGLKPVPEAERRTLIRRASYGLTGLPPSVEEIRRFEADARANAYERMIDRLLESPRYGEHWGRKWLDVVRYADSAGFSNDFARVSAWRYRDYVIRSFNEDKPYDQMALEQIAGDELDPSNPEYRIATGFLRMGPWEHTGMSVKEVTRQQFLDDVTNSVGVTFLGQELACAKCHDHKFDPIPTRDYYRIFSCFTPVQFADVRAPFLPEENTSGLEAHRDRIQRLIDEGGVDTLETLPSEEKPGVALDAESQTKGIAKVNRKRSAFLNRELTRAEPTAFGVYSGPDRDYRSNKISNPPPESIDWEAAERPDDRILTSGSVETPGESVTPGALSVVASLGGNAGEITKAIVGRRRDLAEWIADPENPLTARVMVNRIWQGHFGRGLAANPNNFGKMGGKPTHPELLDYLALRFMESGWSVKAMHRLIMTSAAYRRTSVGVDAALVEMDPENKWLARFSSRRLEAEELRDSLLMATDELNLEMGGIPVRPEIHIEVAMRPRHIMGSVGPAYQPNPQPEDRHRRGIYAERIRTLRDPLMEVFNQPGFDTSSERRDSSTVTPQSLTLLNSRYTNSRARVLGIRIAKETSELGAQVRRAWEAVYGRRPDTFELERGKQHIEGLREALVGTDVERVELPSYVVREMVEEMTGLNFYWVERLDQHAKYVPDYRVEDLSVEARALADLILVLFNSNEFLYID